MKPAGHSSHFNLSSFFSFLPCSLLLPSAASLNRQSTPMSDESQQRMTALKRAYADIIFNTTKESATRILASQRRALQQNLTLVKEESLAMLLRLKAIMEAKVCLKNRNSTRNSANWKI